MKSPVRDYVCVDLETTGLHPKTDKIIEIGAVRVRDGRAVQIWQSLVNPGRELTERTRQITGIRQEEVDNAPDIVQVLPQLLDFLGKDILVGHSLIFDFSFLKKAAVNAGLSFEADGIDTLKLARKFLTTLESRSLEAVCCHYGVIQEKKHRAFEDALSAYRVYECMKKEFGETDAGAFCPEPLIYRVKKQSPVTISQKRYLNDLIKYHRIELAVDWETMTKSQASQLIDRILSNYGRIKR